MALSWTGPVGALGAQHLPPTHCITCPAHASPRAPPRSCALPPRSAATRQPVGALRVTPEGLLYAQPLAAFRAQQSRIPTTRTKLPGYAGNRTTVAGAGSSAAAPGGRRLQLVGQDDRKQAGSLASLPAACFTSLGGS